MPEEHFVIIGNGPAGHQAALTLRECAPEASVTVISKDRGAPYRPHRLPQWIAGERDRDGLAICPVDAFREKGIHLRCSQRVVALELDRRRLIFDHKEILPFTGLVLAVGGRPHIPEPLLSFQDVMFTLKTQEDARMWKEALSQVSSILMIGGDLTSLAMTRVLLRLGKRVHFMLSERAFWPLRSSDSLFEDVTHSLSRRGVDVIPSRRLQGIVRISENLYEVIMDGESLQVGMVGAFFGLVPDIRFLAGCGLRLDRGILVDEYLWTGFERVYATGDCAQIYHPEIRDYWVSVGHDNAVALGRTAALNLAGGMVPAEAPGESIFDVEGIKVNTSWWMDF